MILRDTTAAYDRAGMARNAFALPASLETATRLPSWRQASRRAPRAAQLAAGAGLAALGALLAGRAIGAMATPAGIGLHPPAQAQRATLAPALHEGSSLGLAPAASHPARPAVPPTARPVTLSAQHAAILAAAGPGTPDAVRAYLAGAGRNLLSVQAGAITGGGRQEVLLMGSGSGCASCHTRWIAVWDVGRQVPVWEAGDGVDTVVTPVGDGLGFVRTDAVWSSAGPSCCHAVWEHRYLTWDGTTFGAQFISSPLGEPAATRPRPS